MSKYIRILNGGRMGLRTRIVLGLLWTASLIIVGPWGRAQTPDNRAKPPYVISGSDLGFRVEGRRGDSVTGTFVVRINGQWVVADRVERLHPLTDK